MKRSPLLRRTPLARGTSTLKRSWIKRKRPRVRDDADPKYRAWLRRQNCAVPGCPARPCDPHHHSLLGAGMAKKAPDRFSFSLCNGHHVHGLHKLAGFFKGWTKERLRKWQDMQCAFYREIYEREIGAAA